MRERRAARSADAETIVAWFPDRSAAISWGGRDVPDPLTALWLTQQFEARNYWVWAEAQGRLDGVFRLVFPEPGLAHLTRFAVAPDMRGRGLGKDFLVEIIDFARLSANRSLSLGVYGSNRIARRLYEQTGFQVVGERSAAEDPSGVSVKMKLDL